MGQRIDDATWRKSSYSGPSGGDCVEVGIAWRKSTHGGASGGGCVEVGAHSRVLVRDTTNRSGAMLAVSLNAWRRFTHTLR